MSQPYVTRHARQRMKERVGKGDPERCIKHVIERGVPHAEIGGQLRKYMDSVFCKHHVNAMYLYNFRIYIWYAVP